MSAEQIFQSLAIITCFSAGFYWVLSVETRLRECQDMLHRLRIGDMIFPKSLGAKSPTHSVCKSDPSIKTITE